MKDFVDFLKLPPYILRALVVASGILLILLERNHKNKVRSC
jgi:hypothetical protein